jgi:hypothetical protein
MLGEMTISNSTVRKYVGILVLSAKKADIRVIPESEGELSLHDRITLVFSKELFLSVPQIAKKVMMSKSSVHHHLTQTMKWKLRHLKWVPHNLTESEKRTG